MNLYLYLPQHSCHPPGMVKGLIFGFVHRAKTLCTKNSDRMPYLRKCYYRLVAGRGYSPTLVRPLFLAAIKNVLCNSLPVNRRNRMNDYMKPIYLHLPFNPCNPSSSILQKAFQSTIIQPPDKEHFATINTENAFGATPDFNRCVICYSGQRNLGNILIPRKHRFGTSFSVKNFFNDTYPSQHG